MVIKVYQKYIIKEYLNILLKISFIFFSLGFIMGILEELNFFSGYNVGYLLPVILVMLNIPSLLYEIAPFIFLLSSQFLFIRLIDKEELITFKNNGLNNSKILLLLTSVSLIVGILIIIIFYNFSAVLKFKYMDIKKNYTKDNKYLATVTENGLWIKDEIDENILFINAKKFNFNNLIDVEIIKLDKNFNFEESIQSKKIDIKKNIWTVYNPVILNNKNKSTIKDKIKISTNFNSEKINNLFSNLSTLTLWNIFELKENYQSINYSTTEIDYHLQRIISYPFLITIMSLLSAILMLNIKFQRPKLFLIITAIFLSVCIYYINYFFGAMGKNEKLPLLISVWIPILILTLISIFGMVRINEK